MNNSDIKLTSNNVLLFMFCSLILLSSCSKQHSIPSSHHSVILNNDELVVNGKPFAKIIYSLWPEDEDDENFRGISIYYYNSSIEEWIFPKKGWNSFYSGAPSTLSELNRQYTETPKSQRIHEPAAYVSDAEIKLYWCKNLMVSEDGLSLIYTTYGLFDEYQDSYQLKLTSE